MASRFRHRRDCGGLELESHRYYLNSSFHISGLRIFRWRTKSLSQSHADYALSIEDEK
jgi:hypothetical protein